MPTVARARAAFLRLGQDPTTPAARRAAALRTHNRHVQQLEQQASKWREQLDGLRQRLTGLEEQRLAATIQLEEDKAEQDLMDERLLGIELQRGQLLAQIAELSRWERWAGQVRPIEGGA